MAGFLLNTCRFNDCGLAFKSLGRLIEHIEETHIDFDPRVVEELELQQPHSIHLSYILRYNTNSTSKKENAKHISQTNTSQTTNTFSADSSLPDNETEEIKEVASDVEDSNESWTTSEEFTSDLLKVGNRTLHQNQTINQSKEIEEMDRPYGCTIPGCKKRYKNINGIRYHNKNGHKNDGKIHKPYKCSCGKSYKTPHGLKNHKMQQHSGLILPSKQSQTKVTVKTENDCEKTRCNSVYDYDFENTPQTSLKVIRPKVPAIEDHGYNIKQENPETDYEHANLGILTPVSSPVLSKMEQSSYTHSYQKYANSAYMHRN